MLNLRNAKLQRGKYCLDTSLRNVRYCLLTLFCDFPQFLLEEKERSSKHVLNSLVKYRKF